MLSQICLYLNNWFDFGQSKFFGKLTIEDGVLDIADGIQNGQYYRIVGSVFNDGVYQRGEEELTDEIFKGAVWLMAIPQDVISLAGEIEAWQEKYGGVNSENMSPFKSESWGGYNYTKDDGGSSGSSIGWQDVFKGRLRRYKKI